MQFSVRNSLWMGANYDTCWHSLDLFLKKFRKISTQLLRCYSDQIKCFPLEFVPDARRTLLQFMNEYFVNKSQIK